ncbi:MAG: hypothetical protein NC253_03025 [Ruminococcus sp.]|nr:hypothetical protein [Ruminococcus sp.]MCM1380368.1 hypothetical protein [Muribaculaceae bacterium]MCM1478322.1 hypothetical protein [Muribaculaceae bacterium]
MKREKIFKKAAKCVGIHIINNTYADKNGEVRVRNQWVSLGGAAYVIDFPRELDESEILYLAGVKSENVCDGFVKFFDSTETGLNLSDYNEADIAVDRCNFTVNGEFTLFRAIDRKIKDASFFIDAEYLALIDDEKDVDFFLRKSGVSSPHIIAKKGLVIIAVFLPIKFGECSSFLADNAYEAYRIISREVKNNAT